MLRDWSSSVGGGGEPGHGTGVSPSEEEENLANYPGGSLVLTGLDWTVHTAAAKTAAAVTGEKQGVARTCQGTVLAVQTGVGKGARTWCEPLRGLKEGLKDHVEWDMWQFM